VGLLLQDRGREADKGYDDYESVMNMMKRFSFKLTPSCLLVCMLLVPFAGADKIDFDALTKALREMILDKQTRDADLQEAISRLGKVSEPSSFWNDIANEQSYSVQHRRSCIQALLRRHRGSAGTVGELAVLLNHPKWLRDEDISIVEFVVGLIPVEWTPEDTIFRIRLLPASANDKTAVYVRVAGKVGRDDFSRLFRSDRSAPLVPVVGGRPIVEIGFSDSTAARLAP
jgi:hypothetical protein